MTVTYSMKLDGKGRTSWPQALREAAHLSPGDVVVARVQSEGTVVVETREAVKRRMRERAAAGRSQSKTTERATESLLTDRKADRSLS